MHLLDLYRYIKTPVSNNQVIIRNVNWLHAEDVIPSLNSVLLDVKVAGHWAFKG